MVYSAHYGSPPFGKMTMASDGSSLIGLWFDGQKYFAGTLTEKPIENNNLPVFRTVREWLDDYFAGKKPPVSALPLAPKGSVFRQAVWDILCRIPYGEVTTYGEIARQMAVLTGKQHMSAQAIGGAVGHNPVSVIIPCHRVVGSNGSLTGYAGGMTIKMALLEHEGLDMSRFFVPERKVP